MAPIKNIGQWILADEDVLWHILRSSGVIRVLPGRTAVYVSILPAQAVFGENVSISRQFPFQDFVARAERTGQVGAEHDGILMDGSHVAEAVGHEADHAEVAVGIEAPVCQCAAGELPDDGIHAVFLEKTPGVGYEPRP